MAAPGPSSNEINIWDLDFALLRGAAPAAPTVFYVNAKAVLLGDSGVGKSGLGIRIAEGAFRPTEVDARRAVLALPHRAAARAAAERPGRADAVGPGRPAGIPPDPPTVPGRHGRRAAAVRLLRSQRSLPRGALLGQGVEEARAAARQETPGLGPLRRQPRHRGSPRDQPRAGRIRAGRVFQDQRGHRGRGRSALRTPAEQHPLGSIAAHQHAPAVPGRARVPAGAQGGAVART